MVIVVVIITLLLLIIIITSDTNLLPTPEKIKKLQKNNVQNTVIGEHIRVDKENDISNASNGTKTEEKKKD